MNTLIFGSSIPANKKQDLWLDVGTLIPRAAFGLTMAFAHGLGKLPPSERFLQGLTGMGFPAPELFAWLAGLSEFAGGLFLAIGLFTRPAAFFLAFTMGVAFFIAHGADPFQKKELAFLYMSMAASLVFLGSGRFSVDALIRKKLK